MSKQKEGLYKSTVNAVLSKIGMADKIETTEYKLKDGKTIKLSGEEPGSIALMVEDGEYELADGRVIIVADGMIDWKEVEEVEEVEEEMAKQEPAKDESEVQMALVEKIIELTNQKAEKEVASIKEAVAAELAKLPTVTPMKAEPKKPEIIELSKKEIKLMSIPERASHFTRSRIQMVGQPKSVKLATTTSITSTYAGEFALPYIGAALLSGETLANENVTIKENVGLAGVTVKSLGTIGGFADATCDFTDTGSVTLTERKLTPKDLEVNLELCKTDFLSDWEALTMGSGRNGKSLPPNFQSFILERVAAEVAANVETNLWQGANTTNEFEGFEAKLSSTVNLTGGAVTASNVKAKLRIITANIPTNLKFRQTMKLYCAADIIQAYLEFQGDNGIFREYQTATVPLAFDGYELIYAPGMTAGSVIAAEPSNLWFGTDLVSDHSEARVLDMEDVTGDKNVRIIMSFTAGTQVGVVGDCVHGIQAA